MSYASAPFWWLTCDAPDCGISSTEDSEYAAWADKSGALDSAQDSDWTSSEDDLHHYCDEHAHFVCTECHKWDGSEFPGERDYLCSECWAEQEAEATA